MHHGSIDVEHDMGAALDEMVAWAGKSGTAADGRDLVHLGITDCDGGSACVTAVRALLEARNITTVGACSQLQGLTVAEAFSRYKLPGGGAIMATFGCWSEHYDPAVACSGIGSKVQLATAAAAAAAAAIDGRAVPAVADERRQVATSTSPPARNSNQWAEAQLRAQDMLRQAATASSSSSSSSSTQATQRAAALARFPSSVSSPLSMYYTCYADSSTKAFPLNRMWSYIDGVVADGPPADGSLYSVQCIWQETTNSVIVGELHGSTLLDDEKSSQLNALLASRIKSGQFNISRINLVEVNNVCDGGPALLAALRA